MIKKLCLMIVLSFSLMISLAAQPIVTAELDAVEYHPGDLVKVRVTLLDNPGLHSLFFFLEYDGAVLAFEDIREGSFVYYEQERSELLYADNSTVAGFAQARTVVSFNMNEPGITTAGNGVVAELLFRVTALDAQSHHFHFSGGVLLDGAKTQIAGTSWRDSGEFSITAPYAGEFIRIRRPYAYQVVDTNTCDVSLICSRGNYKVKLFNPAVTYQSAFIPVLTGSLYSGGTTDTSVPLVEGLNRITAELYTSDEIFLTSDSVRLFYATGSDEITIVKPLNHALLNTDSVKVEVESSLDEVFINGYAAVQENGRYTRRVHLTNGFNTITATGHKVSSILYENSTSDYLDVNELTDSSAAWVTDQYTGMFLEIGGLFAEISGNDSDTLTLVSSTSEIGFTGSGYGYRIRPARESDNVTFKDTIQVYYQKDAGLFRFLTPEENQGFKPGVYAKIDIRGEIDALYRPLTDPFNQSYEKNSVTLEITHYPYNNLLPQQTLYAGPAVVGEADSSYQFSGIPYTFQVNGLALAGLDDGEIEIIAYKNKDGNTWDDKITRYVYIDNKRLWIDLVQPNVYTSDLLDSRDKLEKFNGINGGPVTVTAGAMLVNEEGAIGLNATEKVMALQTLTKIKAMAEGYDGTLYALVNSSSSHVKIYRKDLAADTWTLMAERTGLYGYSLAWSKIGLLLGASNIPANGHSGLYLVNGATLINIDLPETELANVQFINIQEGIIYLYGSLYKKLYAFEVKNLRAVNGGFEAADYTSLSFANTANIRQFLLTRGAGSAVICSDDPGGNIRFYNRTGSGFTESVLPALEGSTVVYGRYADSNYECFVIPVDGTHITVVMKNLESGMLFRRDVDLAAQGFASRPFTSLAGCGFAEDHFYFLYEYDTTGSGNYTHFIERGQIFFNKFIRDEDFGAYDYVNSAYPRLAKHQEQVLITGRGAFYLGIDSAAYPVPGDNQCYQFYKKYSTTGSCHFDYLNEDIEGLKGFELTVDPRWLLTPGLISFGFTLYTLDGTYPDLMETEVTNFKLSSTDLYQLLANIDSGVFTSSLMTINDYYDGSDGMQHIHVEFADLQKTTPTSRSFLRFYLSLQGSGQESPSIANVEVFKKISAKIANAAGQSLVLPIQGFVYDRTVSEVKLYNGSQLVDTSPVGRNGSFNFTLTLDNTVGHTADILVTCKNALGDQAESSFTVEIVTAEAAIWDAQYTVDSVSHDLVPDGSNFQFDTARRELDLSGSYFGLSGALVGYELYAAEPNGNETPFAQGILTTTLTSEDFAAFTGRSDLGPGYEAGTFAGTVRLSPNTQWLVIYVENPGGFRYHYVSEAAGYPSFIYTMPPEEQEILFEAEYDTTAVIGNNIPVEKLVRLEAFESAEAPYTFTCSDAVTGEIRALEQFDTLLVKSYTPGLTFEGGVTELIIPVEPGNRFAIPFTARLGSGVKESFDLAVIPTIPVYNYLKKGLRLEIKKNFAGTTFIPDFSSLHPDNWDAEQQESLKGIPLLFTFQGRTDMPLEGQTKGIFAMNFATEISGTVSKMDSTYYCLRDEAGNPRDLAGINRGRNRLQWTFEYHDPDTGNACTMSSSLSGRPGMEDYTFDFNDETELEATRVLFTADLRDIYYNNKSLEDPSLHLPGMNITKDANTKITVLLNGQVVLEDATTDTTLETFLLAEAAPREGRNELVVRSQDKYDGLTDFKFSFLYDSLLPVVKIASVVTSSDYKELNEITVMITEANFNRAYLYVGANILNLEPVITVTGEDTYELRWSGLTLDPAQATVKVNVVDRAGNTTGVAAWSFGNIQRPAAVEEREKLIEMPVYAGDPAVGNETHYLNRPFPEHTKFAPGKMLDKVNVKDEIEGHNGLLIDNFVVQKVLASDGAASDYFGNSVAISGNYAIVGAHYDDDNDNGDDSGSAYIFERHADGRWTKYKKLLASDGAEADYFGCSVAISGDYAIVGAHFDDDKGNTSGSAYIFERQANGDWVEKEKLLAFDGAAGDYFGRSVAISGDYAIVGAYLDNDNGNASGSAYIFERQADGSWTEQEKLLAADGAPGDQFGNSVSISGNNAIVGAFNDDDTDNGVDSGSAYIFERQADGSWTEQEKLLAADGDESDFFGCSVAISSSYAIVGAYFDNDKGFFSGSAYIFEHQVDGSWAEQPKLLASDGTLGDYFGCSVAISGNRAVVGAKSNDASDSDSGAAYIFARQADGSWTEQEKLLAFDGAESDLFGNSVALSDNYAIVGAYKDDDKGADSGTAYIYSNDFNTINSDSYLDQYEKKYLVFQIAKNNTFQTEAGLENVIRFKFFGLEQDPANNYAISPVLPTSVAYLTIDADDQHTVNGLQYLYYMVSISSLKTGFDALVPLLDFTPGLLHSDEGSLWIDYDPAAMGLEITDIYVTGNTASEFPDIIVCDEGYEGDDSGEGYMYLNEELQTPLFDSENPDTDRTVTLTEDATEFTLSFWLRVEDEDAADADYAEQYKRVLTFLDPQGEELYHCGYNGQILDMTEMIYEESLFQEPVYLDIGLKNEEYYSQLNSWNFVLINFKLDPVNDKVIFKFNLRHADGTLYEETAELQAEGITSLRDIFSSFYFGALEPDFNTGFFSIANPFYLNRTFSEEEINRLFALYDYNAGGERNYNFNSAQADYGTGYFDLHAMGGSDAHVSSYNADYTTTEPGGALKGSSAHPNHFKTISDGSGEYVILKDANSAIFHNLVPVGGSGQFSLQLEENAERGTYYFGDKNSNYGLTLDSWYSITGQVVSLEAGSEAWLVMRLNGREERLKLSQGQFHFIYNYTLNQVPVNVKVFIESTGDLVISNDLVLNEGNYRLPVTGGLEATAASTTFPFDLSGSVDLRYKPFITNREGLVNYETVILDSEFLEIGTRFPTGGGNEAIYYAKLKNSTAVEPIVDLNSSVKADHSWKHLQVAWDSEKGVAYFYINGKIVDFKEEITVFPKSGTFTGSLPSEDNVYIGCDMERKVFAEGYLDDVQISKYYSQAVYIPYTPAQLVYDEANHKVDLIPVSPVTTDDFSDISWTLRATDNSSRDEGISFPLDVSDLPPGRYQVAASLAVNGFGFDDRLSFNLDTRPRFNLVNRTPFLFLNEPADLFFTFEYDHSYCYETEELQYAGLGLRLKDSQGKMIEAYLCQDFLNQNPGTWLFSRLNESGELGGWTQFTPQNDGKLKMIFPGFMADENISCEYIYYYFTNDFPGAAHFSSLEFNDEPADDTLPLAALSEPFIRKKTISDAQGQPHEYEYLVEVGLNGSTTAYDSIFEEITIEYEATRTGDGVIFSDEVGLEQPGGETDLKARIYYDDMFGEAFGTYDCIFRLKYKNIVYAECAKPLVWEKIHPAEQDVEVALDIDEFALCTLDKKASTADFYLLFSAEGVGAVDCTLEVRRNTLVTYTETLPDIPNNQGYIDLTGIPMPEGAFTVKVRLEAEDPNLQNYIRTAYLQLENEPETAIPEVLFTNTVDNQIAYNDVFFSWKGYVSDEEGVKQYNSAIEYSYSFDSYSLQNQGNALWSGWNSNWRSVRFYNLEDGYHTFYVKARYDGMETVPLGKTFFVDIHRPQFNADLINIEYHYDSCGILDSVSLSGIEGAVSDASLRSVEVNTGQDVILNSSGSFLVEHCPITRDGITEIVLTAYDEVGNYRDQSLFIENRIIDTIKFPQNGVSVKYSPLTLVGNLRPEITAGVKIYVQDPFCPDASAGDYSDWKEAVINPDRTFFVEDLMINPGTAEQKVKTTLNIAEVFESGKTFTRQLEVEANELLLPIEMKLSTHAVEGETGTTAVDISCYANVDHISSWSADFDGDGIYDRIDLTANPESESAKTSAWSHVYSHLGQVNPRVRVITTDGNFFSVSDSLIIHEKIKEASHKLVEHPLSLATCLMDDNSERIFVLKGATGNYLIDVFQVGRNENYISGRLYSIDLSLLGLDNPVQLRAIDSRHLIITSLNGGNSRLSELVSGDYGNYTIARELNLEGMVKDISIAEQTLYLSFADRNYLMEISLTDQLIPTAVSEENIKVPGTRNAGVMGEKSSLAKDDLGLLVADYYNQRVLRLTDSYNLLDQYGSYGVGEKEFLTPTLIRTAGDRIFVYDETRMDIQVFDEIGNTSRGLNNYFVPVCTLGYNPEPGYANYLEAGFFNEIADMAVITRSEGNRDYYYALILSQSTGKLAMLRIPQYKDLRARVRNNKIAYIREGEIFTAKPDGSDERKILSSDSLPRVEGALDYPALAPDGKLLVFTSRLDLYIGRYRELASLGNPAAYDHIYLYNIEHQELTQLDLGQLEGYEVERPVFSSNGDTLVFSAKQTGGRWQIYLYDFAAGEITLLFESDENARHPYYSPDDRFIVFTTDYDGDEDIIIVDTQNVNMRVAVTNNNARDAFPVWISVYPDEIGNDDYKIESKIAYISERNYHKSLYSVYLSRQSETDIRVVTANGQDTGSDPDSAARLLTPIDEEGDYPCFVGDSTAVVFEHYDGQHATLKKYDYTETLPGEAIKEMPAFDGATRPAGMKNSITRFTATNINGDEIALGWERYVEEDIFYTVQFKPNNKLDPLVEKRVFSQTGTTLKGLKMGTEYLVRVCIVESNVVAAASQWTTVRIPTVVAKPTYAIDPANPYLVHLHAWKPPLEADSTAAWYFSWIIDNNEILVQKSQDYAYEFSTSGEKTIQLKAYTDNHNQVHISAPFAVEIKSNIIPRIDYVLAEDASYVELSCRNSAGSKINFPSAVWTISGPNGGILQYNGPEVIAQLNGFSHKVNVALNLQRLPVNGQQATDTLETSRVIDLDFRELKPVITTLADSGNSRLIHFSGRNSIGNIDWFRARWTIFADTSLLYQTEGVASFDYLFPAQNTERVYSVSLTVPQRSDGLTETISRIVSVEAAPLEPQIDYQVLNLEQDGNVVGQKILFDCSRSRGSNIDFSLARWSIPSAGSYGEQPVQLGPVAIYNLTGIEESAVIEVALTLCRQGGLDPLTVTRNIAISGEELADGELIISRNILDSSSGKTVFLDVLQSTGPNILWEQTEWLIDGQYARKGPSIRYDLPASVEDQEVTYRCTLYRQGGGTEVKDGSVRIDKITMQPAIHYARISGNVYRLDVLGTEGVNIDWDRTRWYIHDGNQEVVVKQGAEITHAFAVRAELMGYPVVAEMFLKGDSKPFIDYTSIDIGGDHLTPTIETLNNNDVAGAVQLIARSSSGSNIDWPQCKWTILETAQTLYGPVVSYKFPSDAEAKQYTVTLTLYRKLNNGEVESRTSAPTPVTVAADPIVPRIKAWVEESTLVLSAERSTGRGMLLDRATWSFPGEGDNISEREQGGVITRDTKKVSDKAKKSSTANDETLDYTDYVDKTLSTTNYHTGPICRRYIGDATTQIVTLYVYRMTPEGGVEGKSITVNVDISKAKTMVEEGVDYE